MTFLKMTDLDLRGKRVLIRVDFNVPAKDGKITDDTRIRAALPGIRHALGAGARVMLTSHFGRPKEGEFSESESLAPVARHLSGLIGVEVPLVRDWLDGVEVEPGKVVLLENCRFNKGEKKNDDALAKRVAALCDIYVNDAFGTAHRAEVSGPISRIISSAATAVAGFTVAAAVEANSLATTTSVGIGTAAPRAFIAAMIFFASSTSSASASDLPIGRPAASMKVLAMPPPTMS